MSSEDTRRSQEPNGSDWEQRKTDHHAAVEPAWGEGRGGHLADQLAEAMSPEMQAAAFVGLADNPIAQTYAEGKATPETRARLLAARDTALIAGTDTGSLAFIVRDLMDAAGCDYQPARPLHEQAAECCDLIREQFVSNRYDAYETAIWKQAEEHGQELTRKDDLVAELRADLAAERERTANLDRLLQERDRQLADCRVRVDTTTRILEDRERQLAEVTAEPGELVLDESRLTSEEFEDFKRRFEATGDSTP